MKKLFPSSVNFLGIALLMLLSSGAVLAQGFAILGTGTTVNGTTTSSPVNNYYRRAVCQFVYTAAELNAAGVPAGATLTQIGWYVTSNANQTKPGYTVKIKHVSNTNVASALGTTGWTTVINPFTYPTNWPTNTWQMITFNNNFVWDGVSNLGVEVCWSQTAGWTSTGQCRIYSTTSGYRYSWTDVAGNSCGLSPASVNTNKPHARFAYLPPVCSGTPNSGTASVSPSNACPNTSVSLSASGISASGGITYQWESASSSTGPWTNLPGATTIPYSVTPSATTYYRLVTTCTNSGNTANSNAVLFTLNTMTPPSVSGTTTLCTPGTTVLTASGAASGEVYEWYSDSLATNLLHTGATYTTPTLSANDTFYVRKAIASAGSTTFTNCSQTGRTGPSQAQCNSAYGAGVVTVSGGIQYWTVPVTGTYTIEAAGAGFNGHAFQRGATMRGDFNLTAGTQLKILVGQMGSNFRAGNGGTFVTYTNNSPLVVAGGAGGYMSGAESRNSGQTGTCGLIGTNSSASSGGCSGGGGGGNTNAGGGGGLTGNGTTSGNTGGDAFVNGGQGGSNSGAAIGGFGGGGSASSASGSAGGGGYSGGGRSWSSGNAGGGGSINNGTNQVNVAGNRIGHGQVIITHSQQGCASATTPVPVDVINLPTPSLTPAGNVGLCQGDTLIVRANSAPGYLWSGGQTADSILVITGGNYEVQTISGQCTSAVSSPLSVSMETPPTAPQSISSLAGTTFCEGTQTTLSISGGSDGSGAITEWFRDSCSTGASEGTGTTIALTPPSTATYYAQRVGTGACSSYVTTCASLSLTIDMEPTDADSVIGLAAICQGQNTLLEAVGGSSGTGAQFEWGTGTIGTNLIPGALSDTLTVSPSVNTTYWVRRVATTTCVNSTAGISLPVAVNPNPVIDSLSLPDVCEYSIGTLGASAFVASVNGASLAQVDWDFGDGSTGGGNPGTHAFQNHGTYTVVADVISSHQCTTSATGQITVNPKPEVQSLVLPPQCEGQSHTFSDVHSLNGFNGAAITSYAWDLGDGSNSALLVVSHSYAAPGAYPVSLILTSNHGCSDTLQDVAFYHPSPTISVSNATVVCEFEGTQFSQSSSVSPVNGAAMATYSWDFGDGNTSGVEQPIHVYSSEGNFSYQLIAETNHGCRDTVQGIAMVNPKPVLTSLLLPAACQGFANSFAETHSLVGFNGAAIDSYTWDLGDGSSAQQPSFSHVYQTPGAYPVQLILSTNHGCSDTLQGMAHYNPSPSIVSSSAAPACEQSVTQFSQLANVSVVNGASVVNYFWDFGDGNSSSQASPQHTYATEGNYVYQVVAETNHGCRDTVQGTATVNPKPYIQSIDAPDVCHGNPHNITQSINYTGFNGGVLTLYSWDLGDGNNSSSPGVSHTYGLPGSYMLSFVVESNHGCSDSMQVQAFVNPNPAIQQAASSDVCFLEPAVFAATAAVSSENNAQITAYNWTFGDGGVGLGAAQNYTYTSWGTFTPVLVVLTNHGCVDSLALDIDIHPLPVPDFSPDFSCFGEELQFQNFSSIPSGSLAGYAWNFGDGAGISTQTDPFYFYSVPGTYMVTLSVQSDKGCSETVVSPISIAPAPFAEIEIQLIGPYALQFSPLISIPGNTYEWDFGDGNTSQQETPQHTYTQAGTYTVCVTISDGTCSSQSCQTIQFNLLGEIEISDNKAFPLAVFPNPFSEDLNVQWDLPKDEDITLQLYDMSGRQIWNTRVQAEGGAQQWRFPTIFGQLSSGTYLLNIRSDTFQHSIRVVKTN